MKTEYPPNEEIATLLAIKGFQIEIYEDPISEILEKMTFYGLLARKGLGGSHRVRNYDFFESPLFRTKDSCWRWAYRELCLKNK